MVVERESQDQLSLKLTRSDLIDAKKIKALIKIPQLNQDCLGNHFVPPPPQIPNPQFTLPPFLLRLDLVIIAISTS